MFRPLLAMLTKTLFEFLSKDLSALQLSTRRPIHNLYILYFVGKYNINFVGVRVQNILQ
jgi:predicted transport protein